MTPWALRSTSLRGCLNSRCGNRAKNKDPSKCPRNKCPRKLMHPALMRQTALTNSCCEAAIHPGDLRVKFIVPLMILLAAGIDPAAAQAVPLPRPRPAEAPNSQVEEAPSACRVRLTSEVAIAPSLSTLDGSGECAVTDV